MTVLKTQNDCLLSKDLIRLNLYLDGCRDQTRTAETFVVEDAEVSLSQSNGFDPAHLAGHGGAHGMYRPATHGGCRDRDQHIVVLSQKSASDLLPVLARSTSQIRKICLIGSAANPDCARGPLTGYRPKHVLPRTAGQRAMVGSPAALGAAASYCKDLGRHLAQTAATFRSALNAADTQGTGEGYSPVLVISHQGGAILADQILREFLAGFSVAASFDMNDDTYGIDNWHVGTKAPGANVKSGIAEDMLRMSSFCERQGLAGTADDLMTLALRRHIIGAV